MTDYKIGLIIDNDFGSQHIPPYPRPSFMSFEHPNRIYFTIKCLGAWNLLENERIEKLSPKIVDESILELAHSKYHITSIKQMSKMGGAILSDEVFISENTYELAKKAVGGAIEALECVIDKKAKQSFALIRPPGHHALRDKASGLCIFNNIANAILYLRKVRGFEEKIAIIDIDNHYGDGLAQYFYEDPKVLYYSIHEYDFENPDLGMINELGNGQGLGTNINIPIPPQSTDEDLMECIELFDIIMRQYQPKLIIIATGFDMYFADPIGNCLFTSMGYYTFTKKLIELSKEICDGNVSFILEGGYDLIGLAYCIKAILKALLNEDYQPPDYELLISPFKSKNVEEIKKIISLAKELLIPYYHL